MTALNPGLSPETELIQRRRRQCIVHRIIYYCFNSNIIPDHQYDAWERELRELVAKYPDDAEKAAWGDLCPVTHVGSSNISEYPDILVLTAKMLLQSRAKAEPESETAKPKPKQKMLFSIGGKK